MDSKDSAIKKLSLKRFLYHFCVDKRTEQKFCFILGAGASVSSGIPTGANLVNKWMEEIREIYDKDEIDEWVKKDNIDLEDLPRDYANIFAKRFELDEKKGFAELESMMEGAEPSCGYSVLAKLLADNEHNIVITTNFDSLTEDALFIYTQKKPLVVGHEALAHYIRPFSNRPIIVKIHRDLLLSPKNDQQGTSKMEQNFKDNLTNIFKHYTPVVIGYGGNDGSLMGFLNDLVEIEGGIYWCYRGNYEDSPNSVLNDKIIELIKKFDGWAVPIPGFDDLMMQLGNKKNYARLDGEIIKIAKKRADNYRKQIEKIENIAVDDTKTAVSNMVEKGEKDWWYYEQKASGAKDIIEKERIYQEGLKACPKSVELIGNYALFLSRMRKEYDRAEEYYLKSLALAPDDADFNGNYANFLSEIRKDYDKAEEYYFKTLTLVPDNADFNGNYALFLKNIRKYDKAEEYYQKALALAPDDADFNGNYANFLSDIRKDYDKAEEYYQKALTLAPEDANKNANYAVFLSDIRKDYDKAEDYYHKVLVLAPDHAHNNGNYALFLKNTRKDYDKAEEYYQKALALAPDDADFNGNYANFLSDIRKDYDKAEGYYHKALALAPDDANFNGNYAKILVVLDRLPAAKHCIAKAFKQISEPENSLALELWFYRYAVFFEEYSEAKDKVKALLDKGITSPFWYLDDVVQVAKNMNHPDYNSLVELARQISAS